MNPSGEAAGRKPSGHQAARTILAAMLAAWSVVSVAQEQCNEFRADWRTLLKEDGATSKPLCKDNEVYHDRSGMLSATLDCVKALYDREWGAGSGVPQLVFTARLDASSASGASSKISTYGKWWVIRTSPHGDKKFHVCPEAPVWVEVARRPRITADDWGAYAAKARRENRDISSFVAGNGPLSLWRPEPVYDATFAGKGSARLPRSLLPAMQVEVRYPTATHFEQFPAVDEILEPWQKIILIGTDPVPSQRMPDVMGLPLEVARQVLQEAQLRGEEVSGSWAPLSLAGTAEQLFVTSQWPEAQADMPRGLEKVLLGVDGVVAPPSCNEPAVNGPDVQDELASGAVGAAGGGALVYAFSRRRRKPKQPTVAAETVAADPRPADIEVLVLRSDRLAP
jgi:hypothetical protein